MLSSDDEGGINLLNTFIGPGDGTRDRLEADGRMARCEDAVGGS